MPAYVDTSALVKRYVAEVGSAWLRRLLAAPGQQVIYTCTLAQAEVISALQRRVREGRLEAPHAQRLSQRVAVHFAQRYQVMAITQAVVDQACEALQVHALRAADAIHLSCALTIRRIAQEQELPPPSFVGADDALLAAATAEGFTVENPLQYP
jgi:predicted nucleic acid-binding protein